MGSQITEYLEQKRKRQELGGVAEISSQIIYFCLSYWKFTGQ